jgi:hypothetical protein
LDSVLLFPTAKFLEEIEQQWWEEFIVPEGMKEWFEVEMLFIQTNVLIYLNLRSLQLKWWSV